MFKTFARVFRNEEEAIVEGVELWSVRWTSITGTYSSDKKPIAEFFTSKEAAERFASALKDAFKLTRNAINSVEIQKESTPK